MSIHNCPVHGCTDDVDDTHLVCRRHWGMVPISIRTRLYAAYRVRQAAGGRKALRLVQREVVAHINRTLQDTPTPDMEDPCPA